MPVLLQQKAYARAILIEESRVLMGYLSQPDGTGGMWDFVGGPSRGSENPELTLFRELGDELAIVPRSPVFCGKLQERGTAMEGAPICHYYKVEDWSGGAPRKRTKRFDELRWFTLNEACRLPDLARSGYRPLLRAAMG